MDYKYLCRIYIEAGGIVERVLKKKKECYERCKKSDPDILLRGIDWCRIFFMVVSQYLLKYAYLLTQPVYF